MYINTVLTYAGPPWGALISKDNWEKLESVQSIALRTITGSPWYIRNSTVLNSLGLKSMQESIITATYNMFHKITTSYHKHLQDLGLKNAAPD